MKKKIDNVDCFVRLRIGMDARNPKLSFSYPVHLIGYSHPKTVKRKHWLFKRILLNIGFFLLNFALIVAMTYFVATYLSGLYPVWLLVVFVYGLTYRHIVIKIMDSLIGDCP